MKYLSLLTLTCAMSLAAPAIAAEPVLSHYRGVTLGDSIKVVVDRLQMAASDVKVVHERAALVQELTWRPRSGFGGLNGEADSVSEMILTFHDGKLAQISVIYDRPRTQGLTNLDLQEALARTYGTALLPSTPTQPASGAPALRQPIGRWEDAETLLILWREQFPNRVGLTITSIAADGALQRTIADGVRNDLAEAPAREVARRAAEVAALKERDEKIRLDNKTKFKP
jgi:hypothetical protein